MKTGEEMAKTKKYHGICEECEYFDVSEDEDDLGEKICHADLD